MTRRLELEELATAIAESGREDAELEGGILLGFVVVGEMMAPDGTRWLFRLGADGSGDPYLITSWQADGYLEHAKTSRWPLREEEDEDA